MQRLLTSSGVWLLSLLTAGAQAAPLPDHAARVRSVASLKQRIGKRVAQVMELAQSFPGHQDVNKHESYGGAYYNGYYQDNIRITGEWQQNRRGNTSGKMARREVLQELDAERTRLSDLKQNLADREQWLKDNPPATN